MLGRQLGDEGDGMTGESGLSESADAFWKPFWQQARLRHEGDVSVSCDERGFFPLVRLSYAENLIEGPVWQPESLALTVCHAEKAPERLTRAEIARRVRHLACALRRLGLGEGDRVALVPRSDAQAVVAVLAVASLGASLALVSPETGAMLMTSRLKPLAPKLLLVHAAPMAHDTGLPLASRVVQLVRSLPSLENVVVLDDASSHLPSMDVPVVDLSAALASVSDFEHAWQRFSFAQPLFITSTAGAQGETELLVHGAGGVLLEHVKEHRLHLGLGAGSTLFAPASVASAMWLWQLSALASGAGIVLYDGPVRDARTLWRVAGEGKATVFVAGAPYLRLGMHAGLAPSREFGLEALQAMLYTGMTLDEHVARWVHEKVAPVPLQALCLSPDLLSCLLLQPAGCMLDDEACLSLGLGVQIGGIQNGTAHQLLCSPRFPSRPLGYLDDPDGSRFRAAYLDARPGYWASGERVERSTSGSLMLRGRVDGLMNVRGARVVPAELAPVLREFPEFAEAAIVEQHQSMSLGEARAILFVVTQQGQQDQGLESRLVARLRKRLNEATSPAHVPDLVLAVPALPRLIDGRLCEAALRDLVNDRPVVDAARLRNPEVVDLLRREPALRDPPMRFEPLPPPPAPGWRSLRDHEAYLQALWERIFGFSPIGLDDDFFELGGHSLLAARIFAEIQRSTDQRLAPSTLLKAPTIRQLAAVMDQAAWDLPVPLVQLRSGAGRPFFLVHSLAGTFLELWAVLRALDTQRAVYGLQARAAGDEHAPYVSVCEMAADYIGHMRRVQPTGPYAVGGYSFGGLIAYEIAQQLSRAGETVELVTLIDTHVHGRYLPLSGWGRYCAAWLGVTWRRLRSLPLRGQLDYLSKKAMVLSDRWRVAIGLDPRHPELVGDVLLEANFPPALRRTRGAMLVALREYRPQPYFGRVVFLRASQPSPGDPLPVWRKVVRGGLEIDVTPGDHDEMISGGNAKALAVALARHL